MHPCGDYLWGRSFYLGGDYYHGPANNPIAWAVHPLCGSPLGDVDRCVIFFILSSLTANRALRFVTQNHSFPQIVVFNFGCDCKRQSKSMVFLTLGHQFSPYSLLNCCHSKSCKLLCILVLHVLVGVDFIRCCKGTYYFRSK
jgi:hypothetical protein